MLLRRRSPADRLLQRLLSLSENGVVTPNTDKPRQLPRIVYLDQNKWIALARLWHGKKDSSVEGSTLTALLEAVEDGSAVFPLSVSHYMETWKNGDPGRRRRLAEFMVKLSQLTTMAPIQAIVRHELEVELARLLPGRVEMTPFELLGKRLAHATGNRTHSLNLVWPETTGVSLDEQRVLSGFVKLETELIFLSRAWPDWVPPGQPEPPRVEFGDLDRRFNEGLREWLSVTNEMTELELEHEIRRITFTDIAGLIVEVLRDNGIEIGEFDALSPDTKNSLVDRLPSRAIDMHVRREFKRNTTLKIQASDLNDWAFVGAAAGYVDIVVAERQMTHVLNQPGARTKAKVLSRLDELPAFLSDSAELGPS